MPEKNPCKVHITKASKERASEKLLRTAVCCLFAEVDSRNRITNRDRSISSRPLFCLRKQKRKLKLCHSVHRSMCSVSVCRWFFLATESNTLSNTLQIFCFLLKQKYHKSVTSKVTFPTLPLMFQHNISSDKFISFPHTTCSGEDDRGNSH